MVELDIHCQLEAAEEMHCCPDIGGEVVERRMGNNNDHKECSLEDNGIYEPLLDERQGLAAELQLLSFA